MADRNPFTPEEWGALLLACGHAVRGQRPMIEVVTRIIDDPDLFDKLGDEGIELLAGLHHAVASLEESVHAMRTVRERHQ